MNKISREEIDKIIQLPEFQMPKEVINALKRTEEVYPFDLGNVPDIVSQHEPIHQGVVALNKKFGELEEKGFDHIVIRKACIKLLKTYEMDLESWVEYHKSGEEFKKAIENLEDECLSMQIQLKKIEGKYDKRISWLLIGKTDEEIKIYEQRFIKLAENGYPPGIILIASLTKNYLENATALSSVGIIHNFLHEKDEDIVLKIFDLCRKRYFDDSKEQNAYG